MTNTLRLMILSTALGLTACGGSGGSDGGSSAPVGGGGGNDNSGPQVGDVDPTFGTFDQGYLLDGATNGLTVTYATGVSGLVEGGLIGFYSEGASTLSLGSSDIADLDGNDVIPFAGLSIPEGANADYWRNVATLLLAADSDADASNGVSISGATRTVADSYDMDFDTSVSAFRSTNAVALDAILASTDGSTVPTLQSVDDWIGGIESTHADTFSGITSQDLLLFSEGFGYEGSVVLTSGGGGDLRVSTDGIVGNDGATSGTRTDITSWSSVPDESYPSDLVSLRFSDGSLTLTCTPLRERPMGVQAYCSDGGETDGRFVLGDYNRPKWVGESDGNVTFGDLDSDLIDAYGGRGSVLAGTFSDNTLQGQFIYELGGGDYYNLGDGEWELAEDNTGFRFVETATDDGIFVRIVAQLGLGGFEALTESIVGDGAGGYTLQGDEDTIVAIRSEENLTADLLEGSTFTRYDTSNRSELGTLTFNAGGTTSATGVTWAITGGGNGVDLDGDNFDRCTYAGEVVGDLFFYCDTSYEPGRGRFEQWILDR